MSNKSTKKTYATRKEEYYESAAHQNYQRDRKPIALALTKNKAIKESKLAEFDLEIARIEKHKIILEQYNLIDHTIDYEVAPSAPLVRTVLPKVSAPIVSPVEPPKISPFPNMGQHILQFNTDQSSIDNPSALSELATSSHNQRAPTEATHPQLSTSLSKKVLKIIKKDQGTQTPRPEDFALNHDLDPVKSQPYFDDDKSTQKTPKKVKNHKFTDSFYDVATHQDHKG